MRRIIGTAAPRRNRRKRTSKTSLFAVQSVW
jgi:hypothetical protein